MMPHCHKCGAKMKYGIAIRNTPQGRVTMWNGRPGKLITCYKCPKCGHSEGKNATTPSGAAHAKAG